MNFIRRRWKLKVIVLVQRWTPCLWQQPAPNIHHAILEGREPVLLPLVPSPELPVAMNVEEKHNNDENDEEHHVPGRGMFGDSIRIVLRGVVGGRSGRLQVVQNVCEMGHVRSDSVVFGLWLLVIDRQVQWA